MQDEWRERTMKCREGRLYQQKEELRPRESSRSTAELRGKEQKLHSDDFPLWQSCFPENSL